MFKIKSIIKILIGILGLYLFFDHMLGFTPHDYFYTMYPNIKMYIGTNVVSMFADLSFFTYHTLIGFSIWMILLGISELFKLEMLYNFIRIDSVICFIFINYIITTTLYTIFELTSGNPTFGLYAQTSKAYYNLITNLIVHYGFFIISLVIFIKIKPTKNSNKKDYPKILIPIVIYLLIYYVAVKLTGMYCYKIIWYPYPIFDGESLCSMFGIVTESIFLRNFILIVVLLLILILYIIVYLLLLKSKKNKASRN